MTDANAESRLLVVPFTDARNLPMKRIAALLLTSLLLAVTAHAQDDQLPSASPGQTWKLVWHDEFDGEKLDTTKWTPRPDGKRNHSTSSGAEPR